MKLNQLSIQKSLEFFYMEDDLHKNFNYVSSLPEDQVQCSLKLKDDLILAGLPFFFEAFNYLLDTPIDYKEFLIHEGKTFKKSENNEIHFSLPFNVVLTGERIALNLLQRASAVATFTNQYVAKASKASVQILDTRKTTPGHRALEKYAVQVGGGKNHRFSQMDCWMIKDNHKSFFGGLENAVNYFKNMNTFYAPMIVEIHSIEELKQGLNLDIRHFMLDNFSPELVAEASKLKTAGVTFEVSGGINLENMDPYLIDGVDAISTGSITYNAPHVDISLKYHR